MAEIVGAFGVPHMPGTPLDVRTRPNGELGQLFGAVHEQVEAVDPDLLVVFDTDHFFTWYYQKLPVFAVGVASETSGPGADDWPGLPSYAGIPVSEELVRLAHDGKLNFQSFGLTEKQLEVTRIEPKAERDGKIIDMIGIVTTLEGGPLPKGAIANRLDGFDDIVELERFVDLCEPFGPVGCAAAAALIDGQFQLAQQTRDLFPRH